MAQVYPCISICIYICVCVSGMTTTLVAPTPSHLLGLKEIVWFVPNHQDLCKIKWNHQKTVLCLPKELVNHLVKQMVPPLNALTQMASPPPFFPATPVDLSHVCSKDAAASSDPSEMHNRMEDRTLAKFTLVTL